MAGTALTFAYLSCRNVVPMEQLAVEIQKAAVYFEARDPT